MSLRLWAGRLLLVVGGVLVGALAAEGVARALDARGDAELLYTAPEAVPDGFYVTDRDLLLRPAANQDGWSRTLSGAVRLRTNREGLRGGPVERDARPRWLAVGDSFTLAVQVPEASTFAARLSTPQRQVLNAGVDGYAPSQAVLRYKRLAPAVDSGGVLFTLFLGNDLTDERALPGRRARARGTIPNRPIPQPRPGRVVAALMRHSALFVRLRVSRLALAQSPGAVAHRAQWRDSLALFTSGGATDLAGAVEGLRAPLLALQRAAAARGDQAVVAVAPPSFVIHTDRLPAAFSLVGLDPAQATPQAPAGAVLGLLDELGLAACDLTPALAAAAEARTLYFQWDGHWTPDGHAVVADALADCLEARP